MMSVHGVSAALYGIAPGEKGGCVSSDAPRGADRRQRSPLLVVGITILFAAALIPAAAIPARTVDGEMDFSRLAEAVRLIRRHALEAPRADKGMEEDILRAYCRFFDPWGDYLTRKEFAAFMGSVRGDYFGVEMEIEKKGRQVVLFPFPGGLAERMGIRASDELIAVDGRPVYGQSIFMIGAAIRGSDGDPVQLTISHRGGIPRIFSLRRTSTSYSSVKLHRLKGADYVRITRFMGDTPERLHAILQRTRAASTPLMLDLRGNQGGDLRAAEQCADYFLPPGTPLVHMKGRQGARTVSATLPRINDRRLILLQDRLSASATEVFISALVDNGRAVSVGTRSRGKGVAQRFFPLTDGSALRLTFAELVTAAHTRYNGRGLAPVLTLDWTAMDKAVLQDTQQLVSRILRAVDRATYQKRRTIHGITTQKRLDDPAGAGPVPGSTGSESDSSGEGRKKAADH